MHYTVLGPRTARCLHTKVVFTTLFLSLGSVSSQEAKTALFGKLYYAKKALRHFSTDFQIQSGARAGQILQKAVLSLLSLSAPQL